METNTATGLHHVALTVTDLPLSRAWYQQLLDLAPAVDEEVPPLPGHHKGFHHTIFVLPSGIILALHAHQGTDRAHRFDELRPGLDHLAFPCRDLGEVEYAHAHLDRLGIEHSDIASDALGHALSFRDPDHIALEFWAPRI